MNNDGCGNISANVKPRKINSHSQVASLLVLVTTTIPPKNPRKRCAFSLLVRELLKRFRQVKCIHSELTWQNLYASLIIPVNTKAAKRGGPGE